MTASTSGLPEPAVMNHLINGSFSLKSLGAVNRDGWGLAYYNDTEPTVSRGRLSADSDPNFDSAVQELSESRAQIGVGHVRIATSGASDIPNPHPFIRFKGGRWWAYGHNGGLFKNTLRELIGPEYLENNPPTVGDNWSDPRVVDSELYFLYILKCSEENGWNVTEGIALAVKDILDVSFGTMNFFLTDGETLWAFRYGNTLYYYHNASSPRYSAVASQPPTVDSAGWIELDDYNLIVLRADDSPVIIDDVTVVTEFSGLLWISVFILMTLAATVTAAKRAPKVMISRNVATNFSSYNFWKNFQFNSRNVFLQSV
jgi:predicted glutamine amidotransferase